MGLFEESQPPMPLAERMRPRSIEEVIGQPGAVRMLSAFVQQGVMPSIVLSGPPGSGKTTLSLLMANLLNWDGHILNATSASVKDIRDLASQAKESWNLNKKRTLVFIDEIHRLNKSQQDVLLPFLEKGVFVLAGSTTENPFFVLNQALRSRVQLIKLDPLTVVEIELGLRRASDAEGVAISDEALIWIAERVAGDLRLAFTVVESAALMARNLSRELTIEDVSLCLSQTQLSGDRKGDNHYDLASAFQKSLRGSDVEAAIYYLARFIETGEDPRFIARRLLVTASEDVGNADPMALQIAMATYRAVEMLGMPECRIPLSQATLYVARAPKSNEAVNAVGNATTFLKTRPLDPIPLHLRDAHYSGAKELGHGKGYVYSHNNPEYRQTFLPENIKDQRFTTAASSAVDPGDLDFLFSHLAQTFSEEEWFEVSAETISNEIKWPIARVRQVLNALVQKNRAQFKRMFKINQTDHEK